MLWDLNEGKHLYSLEAGDIVNALVFSPNRYWLCAATASCVKIFDLESKHVAIYHSRCILTDLSQSDPSSMSSSPTSLTSVQTHESRSVCRLPGPLTARLSLAASQTTRSVSGPCPRKSASHTLVRRGRGVVCSARSFPRLYSLRQTTKFSRFFVLLPGIGKHGASRAGCQYGRRSVFPGQCRVG